MAINDLPILSALRTKMQWHQERQRVLAENVSNANTPNFRPSDLVEPKFDKSGANADGDHGVARHDAHLGSPYRRLRRRTELHGRTAARSGFMTKPAGNSVNLEDQMLKVSANQMDYAAATSLYSRSLGMLKTAIGKR